METKTNIELFDELTSLCNIFSEKKINYALIGGLALGFHHYHRATMDIDFLIQKSDMESVKEILCEIKKLEVFYESSEVLQLNGPVDLDIIWASRPDSLKMLQNAMAKEEKIRVVNLHDLVGLKIQSMTNDSRRKFKDLSDIQMVLENNLDEIDWIKIKYYADLFNQWPVLEMIKKDLQNV